MASTSTSTKKAARLAQKGKGKKVRFQGGTIFPLAVAATLILGLALIVYSRQSLPAADASEPTIDQHWHAAYGFYLCDGWVELDGALEEQDSRGQFTNLNFLRTGIHSHDDGVIHWHPINSQGVGRNAVLGVFLDTYDVDLQNNSLTFPSQVSVGPNPEFAAQAPSDILDEYIEGETQCNGEDAEVSVKAWGSFTDTDGGTRYIAEMNDVHLDNDGMVFAIYFTPPDATQVMPPWAQQLPQLGQADSGSVLPEDLLQGEPVEVNGSVPSGTVAPAGTLVPGETVAPSDDTTVTVDPATSGSGSPDSTDG
ncbi:MAG: hypothetical protein ABIP17_01040 [Ilumatobacteraceae bacterium]